MGLLRSRNNVYRVNSIEKTASSNSTVPLKSKDFLRFTFLVGAVLAIILATAICLIHLDHLHMHATRGVAALGYPHAQNLMGQRHLFGEGVEKDYKLAMEYFKLSAAQGHPHASHNYALGHIQKIHTLPPGEAHRLIQHAAHHGVKEAKVALEKICKSNGCQ